MSDKFTDDQLAEIASWHEIGTSFADIAVHLEEKYRIKKTPGAIRDAHRRYQARAAAASDIRTLKEVARTKKQNSHVTRQNKVILDGQLTIDAMMQQFGEMVAKLNKGPSVKVTKQVKAAGKTDMTMEILLSDVHVGKKSDSFCLEVCRQRLRKLVSVAVAEVERKKAHYNVERIVLAMLGDMIENWKLHPDSPGGCEFENPEQQRYAVELIFEEVLTPLAMLGIPVDVVCISGNHDREDELKISQKPGKNSLSWIIYHWLMMLSERRGLKNLMWHIPEGVYQVLEIYGDHILYEHGDRIRGGDRKSFESHLAARGGQLQKVLKGLRLGHWHAYSCLDNGKVIVNASVCGPDSYSDVNAYTSIPGQVINYYVRTKNRDNAFYYSFLVNLS